MSKPLFAESDSLNNDQMSDQDSRGKDDQRVASPFCKRRIACELPVPVDVVITAHPVSKDGHVPSMNRVDIR